MNQVEKKPKQQQKKPQGKPKIHQTAPKMQIKMEHVVRGSLIPPQAPNAGCDHCLPLKPLAWQQGQGFGKWHGRLVYLWPVA